MKALNILENRVIALEADFLKKAVDDMKARLQDVSQRIDRLAMINAAVRATREEGLLQ